MIHVDFGKFNRVLEYQTSTVTTDDLGQVLETFATVSTHRGEVRTPNGRELLSIARVQGSLTHVITTRYPYYTFSPRGRLVDRTEPSNERTYEIVSSVDPDGRRRVLVTLAAELLDEIDA